MGETKEKRCWNCGALHNSDIVWGNGWPMCSEACKAELQERVDRWLE